jgi:hypothetical protein
MYLSEPREQISQGDVLENVPIAYVLYDVDIPQARVVRSHAIVLSHDCEYDKPNNPFAIVASILPLRREKRYSVKLPSSSDWDVRKNTPSRGFYHDNSISDFRSGHRSFRGQFGRSTRRSDLQRTRLFGRAWVDETLH